MNRRDRKLAARARAAAAAVEARDDARAAFLASNVHRGPRAFDGHCPAEIDGRPLFRGHGGAGCGRARAGRVERRGGAMHFVADRDAPMARSMVRPSDDSPPPAMEDHDAPDDAC